MIGTRIGMKSEVEEIYIYIPRQAGGFQRISSAEAKVFERRNKMSTGQNHGLAGLLIRRCLI
jgi:hypothetical protein